MVSLWSTIERLPRLAAGVKGCRRHHRHDEGRSAPADYYPRKHCPLAGAKDGQQRLYEQQRDRICSVVQGSSLHIWPHQIFRAPRRPLINPAQPRGRNQGGRLPCRCLCVRYTDGHGCHVQRCERGAFAVLLHQYWYGSSGECVSRARADAPTLHHLCQRTKYRSLNTEGTEIWLQTCTMIVSHVTYEPCHDRCMYARCSYC